MKTSIFALLIITLTLAGLGVCKDKKNMPKDWGTMSTMSLEYKFMEKRPFFTAPFSFTYN